MKAKPNREKQSFIDEYFIVNESNKEINIKSRFKLTSKATLGTFLLTIAPVFLMVLIIAQAEFDWLIITFSLFLLVVLVFGLMVILKGLTDYVSIRNGYLIFRNSLKTKKIELNGKLKLKVKGRDEHVRLQKPTRFRKRL